MRKARKVVVHFAYRVWSLWERSRGVDFSSIVYPEKFGHDPELVYHSVPSGGRDLRRVLTTIGVTSDDRVIDIGCGQGSAMRTMLRFPFRAVHGVEISEVISATAVRNFERLGDARARVFTQDASTFEGYGEYNVFYIFNPFPAVVMRRVLRKILDATADSPAPRRLIYRNPVCHELVLAETGFRLEHQFSSMAGSYIHVYTMGQDS